MSIYQTSTLLNFGKSGGSVAPFALLVSACPEKLQHFWGQNGTLFVSLYDFIMWIKKSMMTLIDHKTGATHVDTNIIPLSGTRKYPLCGYILVGLTINTQNCYGPTMGKWLNNELSLPNVLINGAKDTYLCLIVPKDLWVT